MFFKDIGKGATDFFKKDFPTSHKVEVTSKPKDVEVKVTADYAGEGAKVTVEPKYVCNDWNLEVNASVDTSNAMKVSANVTDKIAKGLKTSVEFSFAGTQQVTAGVEYKADSVTAKSDFVFPGNSKASANFGLVFQKNELAVGVDGKAVLGAEPSVANINGGLQYKKPDFTGALFVRSKGDAIDVEASYLHSLKCCTLVTGAKYSVNESRTCLGFGWAKKLEDGSTFKTMFCSDGSISASYKHSLSSCSSFTAGTKINTDSMAAKVGVNLSVNL
mmetsp:Transcript_3237/g.11298  ORF Transcript_3237/g.11298 Transcript_3237/m.11298 type:complete len:274 (-) Transcript_3237:75-896(-)